MALYPNFTWMQMTDEVLGYCRLRKIKVGSLFDSNPSQLSSFQASAKNYVSLAHQLMGIRATEWFAQADIQLNIDSITANATFNLDTGINPDYLIPNSWFNVTNGNANTRPLEVWSEDHFNTRFPDKSVITSGPPEVVVLLGIQRGQNINPVRQVRIYPNPDTSYNLTYRCKVNVPQLQVNTDQIFWPYEYQTQISAYAWMLMEQGLGEGKDTFAREIAMKAIADVKLVGTIAQEARKAITQFKAFARMTTSRLRYLWQQSNPQGVPVFDDFFLPHRSTRCHRKSLNFQPTEDLITTAPIIGL